ncbi:serine/threonine-protein kinase [Modestobacter sp. URMC 112]
MSGDTRAAGRVVAGRYALDDELGRGGMGVVWRATDLVLSREVAVKEVTLAFHLSDEERAVLRERTLREARAAARLTHPCVTSVYDVVEDEGKPWVVMECVPSRSLQQLLQEGPRSPHEVARIGMDVLAAVEAAHAAGIVHRDVKPANVLVGEDGRAHLTDFGIATSTGDSTLTTQGAVLGSPSYMSPQRANGEDPQPADDLWSVGATLYTAVEGHLPFDRGEPMATLFAVVSEDPEPMLAAGPLEPVLRGLLTKEPGRRMSAAEARRRLEEVLTGAAPPRAAARPARSPRIRDAVHRGGQLARFDRAELRSVASASRAVLGSVAGTVAESVVREARDQARTLVDRKLGRPDPAPGRSDPPGRDAGAAGPVTTPPRWRFKRRWVVVPVVVTTLLAVLVLVGLAVLLARTGVFGG